MLQRKSSQWKCPQRLKSQMRESPGRSQRQLPQRFSEGDPAHAAFLVGREEGRVILPELRDVNQKQRNNDADDIK